MKNTVRRKILLGVLGLIFILGCQRDDICPETTDTTPMLVINFYDFSTREPRTSFNLTIREVGRETLDTLLYRENTTSIEIPLRTDQDSTRYEFVYNGLEFDENGEVITDSDSDIQPNTDIVKFYYDREEEYINRACSFKVNFLGLSTRRENGDDGQWINQLSVVLDDVITDNLEDDEDDDFDGAHVNLFFR